MDAWSDEKKLSAAGLQNPGMRAAAKIVRARALRARILYFFANNSSKDKLLGALKIVWNHLITLEKIDALQVPPLDASSSILVLLQRLES